MRRKIALISVMVFMLASMVASAAGVPMLQNYVKDPSGLWEYGIV